MSNNIFTITQKIPTIAASLGRIISGEILIEYQFIEIQNSPDLKDALQDIFLGFFNKEPFNNAILVPTSFSSKFQNFFSPNFKIAYIQDALTFLKRVDSKCYSQAFQGFKLKDYTDGADLKNEVFGDFKLEDYTDGADLKDDADLKTDFETRVKNFFGQSEFGTRDFFQAYKEPLFTPSVFDKHIEKCLAALIFAINKLPSGNNTTQKSTLVTKTLSEQKTLPIVMAHAISAIDEDIKRSVSQASQISPNHS